MTNPAVRDGIQQARAILGAHAKSFSLAARLLPSQARDDAAVVYAWCRLADDAVDLAPPGQHAAALQRLAAELGAVYDAVPPPSPLLSALQDVVRRRRLPALYLRQLLAGLHMDAGGFRYQTLNDLHLYCFRVAGTVGLMMCHVLGVSDAAALARAAHLGMAMQLTNICRDVAEDHARGRQYLPRALAGLHPTAATVQAAVAVLLRHADQLYRSGDAGLGALALRPAVAVRAARLLYAAIGDEIAARGFDVLSGRAVVPGWRKRLLIIRALWDSACDLPRRWWRRARTAPPAITVRYPHDIVPV